MSALQAAFHSVNSRQIDRVWLAIAAVFLALAAWRSDQALESFFFTVEALWSIAPFLALSILVAAWVKASSADSLIAQVVSKSTRSAIVIAALAGTLSPFCSCGVVPLIAALLAAGVPLPAVMAFWVSSPLMDPEQFLLMVSILGLEFTLAKAVAALTIGMIAGFATWGLQGLGLFTAPLRLQSGCGSCRPKLGGEEVRWGFWKEDWRKQSFAQEGRSAGLFLLKWLTLAFLIESLMVAYLPPGFIARTLGEGASAIPMAAVLGVPAYLNGFAAVPLMDQLMAQGMAPGAALAFLVGGGMTSIPAAMAVYALARKQVFAWYILLALGGALLAGYLFQAWSLT